MAAPARETWLYGAIGGLFGAGAMTVLRLAARRSGIIDKMVPQAVEEWAAHRSGLESSGGRFRHHVADQALHAGYGVVAGAVYGAVQGGSGRRHLACGAAFGATVWLFGAGVVFSLLDVARPIWRSRPAENAVNLAAHVLYGLSVQLVTEELSQQARRATSDPERHAARVG
jgi:hypothetical protein